MTIFRHNQNNRLYTIAKCTPRGITGSYYEAIPYNHNTFLSRNGVFTAKMNLSDFAAVSEA